jgi:hypothetical protein
MPLLGSPAVDEYIVVSMFWPARALKTVVFPEFDNPMTDTFNLSSFK